MKGRRLWLRVKAHGGSIPAYVQRDPVFDDEGNRCEGYYDHSVPCIVIEHTGNVAAMKSRLHHEILHLIFAGEGDESVAKVLGTSTAEERMDREESIVLFLEPKEYALLASNGWLKYPNPPKFK